MTTTSTATKRRREERNPPTGRLVAVLTAVLYIRRPPLCHHLPFRTARTDSRNRKLLFLLNRDGPLFISNLCQPLILFLKIKKKGISDGKCKRSRRDRKKVMQYCNRLLQNNAPLSMPIPWQKRDISLFFKKGLNDRKSKKPSRHLSQNNFAPVKEKKGEASMRPVCICTRETHTCWPPSSLFFYYNRRWFFPSRENGQ